PQGVQREDRGRGRRQRHRDLARIEPDVQQPLGAGTAQGCSIHRGREWTNLRPLRRLRPQASTRPGYAAIGTVDGWFWRLQAGSESQQTPVPILSSAGGDDRRSRFQTRRTRPGESRRDFLSMRLRVLDVCPDSRVFRPDGEKLRQAIVAAWNDAEVLE